MFTTQLRETFLSVANLKVYGQGKSCGAVFIGLTKAFHTIIHGMLLKNGQTLDLSKRKQHISCGNGISHEPPLPN